LLGQRHEANKPNFVPCGVEYQSPFQGKSVNKVGIFAENVNIQDQVLLKWGNPEISKTCQTRI